MVAKTKSVAFAGIKVQEVSIELHLSSGLPAFNIVGLPDKAVNESKERVRAAINSLGLTLPNKRITVNLAPADIFKGGSHFDLGIALALLAALEVIPRPLDQYLCMGELGLDGNIAPVTGILPAVAYAMAQNLTFICSEAQTGEALLFAEKVNILADSTLKGLLDQLTNVKNPPVYHPAVPVNPVSHLDMSDIKGQDYAKRALLIAAAGGHNVLMIGPPGAGKSMLASRVSSILPRMTPAEALSTSMIHSLAGELLSGNLVAARPFRSPHSSSSMIALIGGGSKAKPGEVSLAHNGILFLDELPEFPRAALDALRQPLETGEIMIARANTHVTYPARFQLIAAMNPCKCGFFGSPGHACSRAPKCAEEYHNRISGPIFDRIDLCVEMTAVQPWDLGGRSGGDTSSTLRDKVQRARGLMQDRYHSAGLSTNAQADGKILASHVPLSAANTAYLASAAHNFGLTARGYHRVIKVARTIADLAQSDDITRDHLSEALAFRRLKYSC
jgi:magnesium chelatase family protein